MIRISFFNEKGGTGKTLFNTCFAAWLKYQKGFNVRVRDFDYPSYHLFNLRKHELELIKSNRDFAKLITQPPYPLGRIEGKDAYTREQLNKIVNHVRTESEGDGFYIMDFPGRFLPNDPVHAIALAGLLDHIIFPVDSDRLSQTSALLVNAMLNNPKILERSGKEHQDVLVMWNRETGSERRGKRDFYSIATETFKRAGIPVCDNRAREFLSFRREVDTFGFIRSTVCYPELNIRRSAPWLEPLFEEILQRIQGTYGMFNTDNK